MQMSEPQSDSQLAPTPRCLHGLDGRGSRRRDGECQQTRVVSWDRQRDPEVAHDVLTCHSAAGHPFAPPHPTPNAVTKENSARPEWRSFGNVDNGVVNALVGAQRQGLRSGVRTCEQGSLAGTVGAAAGCRRHLP